MAAEDRNGEVSTQAECTGCSPRESSFDELAKELASGSLSRRKVLRLMGGVLVGSALASIPGIAWAKPKPIGAKCKDNRHCASGRCVDGVCGCPSDSTPCGASCCDSPEDLCCNGVCTNIVFDRNNCGACGNQCAEGEDCCGGRCVPLNTTENCGCCGCGCLEAEICVNGSCQCPEPGQTVCANVCCPEGHCVIDETGSFTCVA
jgi:Stigma-specific protein, Stig1